MSRLIWMAPAAAVFGLAACGGGNNPAGSGPAPMAQPTGACPNHSAPAQMACSESGPRDPNMWARCAGGLTNDDGNAVAVDQQGNIYLGVGYGGLSGGARGQMQLMEYMQCYGLDLAALGNISFDGMPANTGGDEDPLLAKYDSQGNLLWIRQAAGMGAEGEIRSVAVNPTTGFVIAGGDFRGMADFGPGNTITSPGRDMFVAEYDPNGTVMWAQTATILPDAMGNDRADVYGVAVDPGTGDIVVTGDFQGVMTAGVGPDMKMIAAQGNRDLFVAEYTPQGQLMWLDDAGGAGDDSVGRGATVEPDGSFVIVGRVSGGADEHFTGRAGGDVIVHDYSGQFRRGSDMVLAHYAHTGEILWATHAGSPDLPGGEGKRTRGEGVGHDSLGNLYVAGSFEGCAFFPIMPTLPNIPPPPAPLGLDPTICAPPPGHMVAMGPPGNESDIYFAKYDANGVLLWVKTAGGPDSDRGYAIHVHEGAAGSFFYVGARIQQTVTFGNITVMGGIGDDGQGIAQYDLEGNVRWATSIVGNGDDNFNDLAIDPRDGAVVAAGNINGTIQFAGQTLTSAYTGIRDDDILLFRIPATGM
ncbi:MAG: hypothetical protein MJD61_12655 [Proteobacteria bacterium]|nr:hypothetical protein [Pseudomonadota bacterium]